MLYGGATKKGAPMTTVQTKWNKALKGERAQRIADAYEAGETNLTRLVERFGVSRQTVRRDLYSHKIIPNPQRLKSYVNPRVFQPYNIPGSFGVIGPDLKTEMEKVAPQVFADERQALLNTDPLEEVKSSLSELKAKVEEIETKLTALEARTPVLTWVKPGPSVASGACSTYMIPTSFQVKI